MAAPLRLRVVTADGKSRDQAVSYVRIPTEEGSVGVLPGHAPMLCAVKAGKLKTRAEDGEERFLSVSDGVARVEKNEITLLVTSASEK